MIGVHVAIFTAHKERQRFLGFPHPVFTSSLSRRCPSRGRKVRSAKSLLIWNMEAIRRCLSGILFSRDVALQQELLKQPVYNVAVQRMWHELDKIRLSSLHQDVGVGVASGALRGAVSGIEERTSRPSFPDVRPHAQTVPEAALRSAQRAGAGVAESSNFLSGRRSVNYQVEVAILTNMHLRLSTPLAVSAGGPRPTTRDIASRGA